MAPFYRMEKLSLERLGCCPQATQLEGGRDAAVTRTLCVSLGVSVSLRCSLPSEPEDPQGESPCYNNSLFGKRLRDEGEAWGQSTS